MKILRVRMNADILHILQYFCRTGTAVGFNSKLVGASKLRGRSDHWWVMSEPDLSHRIRKDKNSRGSWCFVINCNSTRTRAAAHSQPEELHLPAYITSLGHNSIDINYNTPTYEDAKI
jgi:hypothetical protein